MNKQEKNQKAAEYRENNKVKFKILDLLIVLAILMNLGAVMLTNMMVLKESKGEKVVLKEVNPVAAQVKDLAQHPFWLEEAKAFFYQIVCWVLVFLLYFYQRQKTFNDVGYFILLGLVVFVVTAWGLDFFNNFGFYLGDLIHHRWCYC